MYELPGTKVKEWEAGSHLSRAVWRLNSSWYTFPFKSQLEVIGLLEIVKDNWETPLKDEETRKDYIHSTTTVRQRRKSRQKRELHLPGKLENLPVESLHNAEGSCQVTVSQQKVSICSSWPNVALQEWE